VGAESPLGGGGEGPVRPLGERERPVAPGPPGGAVLLVRGRAGLVAGAALPAAGAVAAGRRDYRRPLGGGPLGGEEGAGVQVSRRPGALPGRERFVLAHADDLGAGGRDRPSL